MATLKVGLTLNSNDALSDVLSVAVNDTLTVTNPTELSRKSIATGSAQALIASNSAFSYVYIKVISGVNATDFLQVKLGGDALLKVRVGEFAFFPLYSGIAIDAESYGGACVVEYGYWSI
tara:strand:+ start:614 stop:973 length:360 start_codon:yes stop_codon:yes gene_type:complete